MQLQNKALRKPELDRVVTDKGLIVQITNWQRLRRFPSDAVNEMTNSDNDGLMT